jgi:hypothetical protein
VGLTTGTSGSGTRRVLSVPSPLSLFVAGVAGAGLAIATLALRGLDVPTFLAGIPTAGWLLVAGIILG